MAAKKTAKTGSAKKTTRPKLSSSHTKKAKSDDRKGAPAARKTAVGVTAKKTAAKKATGAKATRPAGTKRGVLSAPKRAAAEGPIKAKKPKAAAAAADSLAADDARRTAMEVAIAGMDKKAVGVEILDVAGRVDYADFLVIMTGRSDRQVAALASGIEEALAKKGKRPLSVEGLPAATWVLMDLGDVVVHLFQDEARSVYDIEGLWMDAKRLPLPSEGERAR